MEKKTSLRKADMVVGNGMDANNPFLIDEDFNDPTNANAPQQNKQIPLNRGFKHLQSTRRIGDVTVTMQGRSVDKWMKQQEKAFTGWINAHLQSRSMYINNLCTDIAGVAPLIHLLEILEKKPLKEITKFHKKPRHKFDQLDGMRICLKQIRSRGRKDIKIQFDAEELLRGQQKKAYLALIWRIIVNYAIEETTAEEVLDNKKRTFKTPQARLQWWCNSRLADSLQIENFTQDWSDGKVLVHLMNLALDENDRITAEDMLDMDTEELLEGLLKLGQKHLHIPQLLDPHDLMHSPNKEAVMTYVSLLRTAIEAKDQERSAAEASMGKMKDAFAKLEDNWLSRVNELETRLEAAQRQQEEYAEKLQEERHTNSKQLHAAKDKTDRLYQEIESLKALCLDQEHEKEMMQQDLVATTSKNKQEMQRMKALQLQLMAQNDKLNEQLKEVLDSAKQQSSGNEQQKQAFEMQINNLKANHLQKESNLENKVKELEAANASQRQKFNEFYEQYKTKLEASNKAGREFREKFIVLTSDTEALRKRLGELEALLTIKEKELDAARKREKELLEQLATQETVFRIQLQELGQFIKEMKQREAVREKQQVEAYHKLLKEREARIAKDKVRKRAESAAAAPHSSQQLQRNGKIALDNVDVEAQRMALQHFERRKTLQNVNRPNGSNQTSPRSQSPSNSSNYIQSNASSQFGFGSQSPKRSGAPNNNYNPLLDNSIMDSIPPQQSQPQQPAFDKQTEAVRTKFGNEKIITTWYYTGKDRKGHQVILRHNTRSGKDQKSKRVIVVDGKVRYAEKSKETRFIIKNGRDELKLNISTDLNSAAPKGFAYQLHINSQPFGNLHRNYLNSIATM